MLPNKNNFHPNIRQRQGGFVTILEAIMVGIPVMTMLTMMVAQYTLESAYMAKAQNAGGKSALINKATNAYMSTAYLVLTDSTSDTEVQNMITAGNLPAWVANVKRIGNPANPDYDLCPAHDCIRITAADLLAAKLLQDGTPEGDVYGNTFDIIIRRTGTYGFYDLGAIIATSGTFKRVNEGERPNMTDLWNGVATVGTDGAITHIATASDVSGGYTGSVGDLAAFGVADKETQKVGWFAKASEWPNIKSEGQLVTRAGYLSSAWSSYVRLDGTRPMTGNLNMGGNMVANQKKVKMGDYCDGGAGAPEAVDMDKMQAMTDDGQLVTCRAIVAQTPAGVETRKRWAKATPGYMTASDILSGSMDGVLTDEMYIWLGPEWDGTPDGWKRISFIVKRVPAGGTVLIPKRNPDGSLDSDTRIAGAGGESAVIIVKNFGTEQAPIYKWVGYGPYRIIDPDSGKPTIWANSYEVNIPNTRNTPNNVQSTALTTGKNWVYSEWQFSASGLAYNVYASVPLTLLDGDHNLRAGSATVTIPATCPTCSPVTVPVDGGKIDGTHYTPYAYNLHFNWGSYYYGQICHWSTGQCLN